MGSPSFRCPRFFFLFWFNHQHRLSSFPPCSLINAREGVSSTLAQRGAYDNLDRIREAAVGPHHWALEYEYEFETPVDGQIVPKAKAILDVWEFIEMSYERLSEEDQKALTRYRLFDGFDLNDNLECTYYSVVRVLIERLDRWSRFKGRDLNSHSPSSLSDFRRKSFVFNDGPF